MFYDRFCELCSKRGVSVTKATEEIGLARSIGTKWKSTGATPNGATLERIANYFGVTVSDLLSEKPAPLSESELDALLVAKLTALSPAEVERVEAYIDGILASRKG